MVSIRTDCIRVNWSRQRRIDVSRAPKKRDPAALHCAAFPEPSQARVAAQRERGRFRRRHLYLHSGANAGICAAFHRFDHREQRRARPADRVFAPLRSACSFGQEFELLNARHRLYFEGITNASEIMRVSRQFSNVVSCSPVLRGTFSARAGFRKCNSRSLWNRPGASRPNDRSAAPNGRRRFQRFSKQPKLRHHRLAAGGHAGRRRGRHSAIAFSRRESTGDLQSPRLPARGVGAIDSTRVYSHAKVAQMLLQRPFAASMIIYKLRDPDAPPRLADHFETVVPARGRKLAGTRGVEPAAFSHPANFGRDHCLTDHLARRFRNFQRPDDVGSLESEGDRDPAFDGLPQRSTSPRFFCGRAR